MRVSSIEELRSVIEKERKRLLSFKYRVYVVSASCTSPRDTSSIISAFEESVKELALSHKVLISPTGCLGICAMGPNVRIEPGGYIYVKMTAEKTKRVSTLHLAEDRPVKEYLSEEVALFFKKQVRLVLRNVGRINPERIEDYFAMGGYLALAKALSMKPSEVIAEVKRSGLRGRGGAGFPTGLKWEIVARATDEPKYVIANLDEGDPGVFANRALAEGDPHAIIEGMLIAGYAVGASKGFIYVRSEYPLAVRRLRLAIKQAREYGLIGNNILGTDFSFDIEIFLGAGAFVAGEETALIASIEGKRAIPRQKPPYPATHGLWGKPTLVNNVETLANIPLIISKGSGWFAQFGTERSKGTKIFSLTGHIRRSGLIEVPLGITLREIVYDIGGGIPDGHKLKAVQIGGPSGGFLPDSLLDIPVDYESLNAVGVIMGSGGIVVYDETTCMVDSAKFFIEFCMKESCGHCAPCRIGLVRIYEILDRITRGAGVKEDLDLLEKLCKVVSKASLCGLGQTAPNPVMTTLKYFKDEYNVHIFEKRCPAGKCPIKRS